MPAGLVHSATVAHSGILTGLTDGSAIGFIASGLVLAAFGMKDMVNLRIVAICSNIAFIMYGFLLDLPPVLILHVMLLPLNGWRLMGALKQSGGTTPGRSSLPLGPIPDFIVDLASSSTSKVRMLVGGPPRSWLTATRHGASPLTSPSCRSYWAAVRRGDCDDLN